MIKELITPASLARFRTAVDLLEKAQPRKARDSGSAPECIRPLIGKIDAIEALADRLELPTASLSENGPVSSNNRALDVPAGRPDLVTLRQVSGYLCCHKRTLERYRDAGKLPRPIRKGKGGKADLYNWRSLRRPLQELFDMILAEVFPANRRP